MNQFIIIQGPLTYYDQIIEFYSTYKNVIISTMDNDSDKIEKLKKYFKLITIPDDFAHGTGNLNCQSKTSFNGICEANVLGATHVLKIRSDMIISDINKFMEILKSKSKISFLAWHTDGYLVDYVNYGEIGNMMEFWNLYLVNNDFAEKNLLNNFIRIKNLKNITFENIKNNVEFFMEDLIKNNIRIYWLKNKIYVSDYYQYECYKYK